MYKVSYYHSIPELHEYLQEIEEDNFMEAYGQLLNKNFVFIANIHNRKILHNTDFIDFYETLSDKLKEIIQFSRALKKIMEYEFLRKKEEQDDFLTQKEMNRIFDNFYEQSD